jgi:hypothetical protein
MCICVYMSAVVLVFFCRVKLVCMGSGHAHTHIHVDLSVFVYHLQLFYVRKRSRVCMRLRIYLHSIQSKKDAGKNCILPVQYNSGNVHVSQVLEQNNDCLSELRVWNAYSGTLQTDRTCKPRSKTLSCILNFNQNLHTPYHTMSQPGPRLA